MDESFPKRKILRLVERNVLASADVFEENFKEACQGFAVLSYEKPQRFFEKVIVGNEKQSYDMQEGRLRFECEVQKFDYISPGYGGFYLLPLLQQLRKNCPVRLLFIAHSPAQHVVEMALVSGRLRSGDVIICPSNNAREIIASLFPPLEPFCVVIPHAMPSLFKSFPVGQQDKRDSGTQKKLVSLCRIAEDKLIHRQIDALAILHGEGYQHIKMEIAGDCYNQNGKPLSYVNELQARIQRLGLEEHVVFRGGINCKKEKAFFLLGADALINLSRTEEESFGKSCAEAITLGVPVISTYWNGLPETVGECGVCVPLFDGSGHLHFDVDPRLCAEAILRMIIAPPLQETFQRQSRKFSIYEVSKKYRLALFGSGETCNNEFEKKSLLQALNPVLQAFSEEDLDNMYLAHLGFDSLAVGVEQEREQLAARWHTVSKLIFQTAKGSSKQLLAHLSSGRQGRNGPVKNDNTYSSLRPVTTDEWINNLLSSCLDKCDQWERGVVTSQLAVQTPALLPWAKTVLSLNEADNFQLIVIANCLSLTESKEDFEANFLSLLERREFCENDSPILLYLYKLVRGTQVFNELQRVTGEWLGKYPDSPGSSNLWGVAGPRLIVETNDTDLRNSLMNQLKAVLPEFDMSRIELAHNAIDLL
ncbi:glycosyltransferase family 4 protein [Desulforhopalus sp. 52FAK]